MIYLLFIILDLEFQSNFVVKNELAGLKENVPLAPYTTFRLGGPARYFVAAKSEAELAAAFLWAKKERLPTAILGGGSNLLVADAGFDGLVIKNENIDYVIEGNRIFAGSGLNLGYLVSQCTENSLTGAEFLVGIPGTVGGAVYGNAGAWGHGIGELVETVKVFEGGKIKQLNQNACQFKYRSSALKEENLPVLSVVLLLRKSVKEVVEKQVSDYLRQRSGGNQPKEPSAGCSFKNVELAKLKPAKVMKGLGINAAEFAAATKHGKLAVGYILERLNLKDKKIGGAKISPAHCNFIINDGTAKAADVAELISYVKQQVRDKVGVQLEEEVQYLGF
ncbi:MAG: UDP-N-acetylmuramate dehydrogenase [Patescibacteria group bacterium]|jgi:UDP-N-acetylmuramate dehydrogenase